MCRHVAGLEFVEWARSGPNHPRVKLKGAALAGLQFEKRVAKALPGAARGAWVRFRDLNGWGYAQPDLLVWTDDYGPVIVECKLTVTQEGWDQLRLLYRPLVERLLGIPVGVCMVVKNLRPGFAGVDGPVRPDALIQWLGNGRLDPSGMPWSHAMRQFTPQ